MSDLKFYEKVAPLEKNFPVKLSEAKGKSHLHWHEHIELLYYTSDENSLFLEDNVCEAKKDELIVVNSGELHATYVGDCFCIRINPSFFSDVQFDEVLFRPHIIEDKTIKKYVYEIFAEKEAQKDGYDLEIKGITYQLMCHLMRNYRASDHSESAELSRNNKANRVGEMLKFIATHCHNKLTTASLAKEFHLTENYLCYLFKSQTDFSPIEYINKFRVEKAATLLKNTNQSITEIALSVGFEDSSYFARVFKKYMGITPGRYRKSLPRN